MILCLRIPFFGINYKFKMCEKSEIQLLASKGLRLIGIPSVENLRCTYKKIKIKLKIKFSETQ